jgi:DNA-directed RNA polymerase subunit M
MLDLGEIMKFCPKCGNLMLPKKSSKGLILECGKCGNVVEGKGDEYKLTKDVEIKKSSTEVIEDKQVGLPTARVTCPKCENDKAYYWIRQTRAGDEPSTRFYRCVKCGHIWREYA